MNDRKLFGIGVSGAVIAALCCFTPLLVTVLGVLGLSAAMLGWLDYVLIPALLLSLGLAFHAWRNLRRGRRSSR